MPTGYTAELMKNGMDFRTFTLRCARAMGACIMQRDDPMDEPPKKQGASSWYSENSEKAKAKLTELSAMSNDQRIARGESLKINDVADHLRYLAEYQAENIRLDEMAKEVAKWEPPTKDHEGFKAFMLEQLSISKNATSYSEEEVKRAEARSPMEYFTNDLNKAERDIEYYAAELQKDNSRNDERNKWIDDLYASLPPVEVAK